MQVCWGPRTPGSEPLLYSRVDMHNHPQPTYALNIIYGEEHKQLFREFTIYFSIEHTLDSAIILYIIHNRVKNTPLSSACKGVFWNKGRWDKWVLLWTEPTWFSPCLAAASPHDINTAESRRALRLCCRTPVRKGKRALLSTHQHVTTLKRVSGLKIPFSMCMINALARVRAVLLMYAVVIVFAADRVVLMSDWWSISMSLYASQIKAFKRAEPKTLGVSFITAHYHIFPLDH